MRMMTVTLNINGVDRRLDIEENWTLLYVLRECLHLMGTKYGCGTADCGSCKVLVDGEAKNSCILLAKRMEAKKIVTIEGISDGFELHPVQRAFVDAGAIQCGYCTPGMVISTVALLNNNPEPTDEEIAMALDNNLCRCTGYKKILDAVHLAMQYIKEGKGEQEK